MAEDFLLRLFHQSPSEAGRYFEGKAGKSRCSLVARASPVQAVEQAFVLQESKSWQERLN